MSRTRDSYERFGYEWEKFSAIDPLYEEQFARWVAPLRSEDFRGRSVLDAACGMGRNAYWALKWGASRLEAFDFDPRTVESARRTLAEFPQARIHYRNIYEIDWENEFDLVLCIGVIHHLEDPLRAVERLVRAAKPGARIVVWVYGFEGNEWIVRYVNPIRQSLTAHIPPRLLDLTSYLCSIPLWLFLRLYRGRQPYLQLIRRFKLWHLHSIVLDQLLPRISHYWKKDEALALFDPVRSQIDELSAHSTNGMSWTLVARKRHEGCTTPSHGESARSN